MEIILNKDCEILGMKFYKGIKFKSDDSDIIIASEKAHAGYNYKSIRPARWEKTVEWFMDEVKRINESNN